VRPVHPQDLWLKRLLEHLVHSVDGSRFHILETAVGGGSVPGEIKEELDQAELAITTRNSPVDHAVICPVSSNKIFGTMKSVWTRSSPIISYGS
jgi:hypothetical protein